MDKKREDMLVMVIPAYNEEANIEDVIISFYPIVEKIGNGSRMLIIDDGSKDGTWKKITELEKKYPLLKGIPKENQGHGAAILYGYKKALETEAEYIFQTDSDGQTIPEEFWMLWEKRKQGGLLIGSRKDRQDGWQRVFVTRTLRLVIRLTFGCRVEDANTPFRLMESRELAGIIKKIPENHPLANVLMSVLYVKSGLGVTYFPITFRPRQGGVNSINMKRIIKIGCNALKDFHKLSGSIK